jgi:hypothetical protein
LLTWHFNFSYFHHMDLRTTILAEHSATQAQKIVAFIGDDVKKFKTLMDLFLGFEYRITQRAAWPLGMIGEAQPQLIAPYFSALVKKLKDKTTHPAVQRNITRIFQFIPLPQKKHGELMDVCFGLLENVETPIAVKVFSLSILSRLAKTYPEIANEIKLIIEQNLPHASPGLKHRSMKVLKELAKLK